MIQTAGLSVKYLKKQPYSGSHQGMRFRLHAPKDSDTVSVWIYPCLLYTSKQLFFAKLLPAGVPFFGVCMSPLFVTHFFHVCTSLLSCLFLFLQSSPEHLIFFLWKMQSDSIDFFPGAKVS